MALSSLSQGIMVADEFSELGVFTCNQGAFVYAKDTTKWYKWDGNAWFELSSLSSGQVSSGFLGNASVVSGNVASGQLGQFHLSVACIFSGNIASGQIASGHLASGLIANLGGALTSGQVVSGNVASGQIGKYHHASGAIGSGQIGITGDPDGTKILRDDFSWVAPGAPTISSGDITTTKIASGAVHGFFDSIRHVASGVLGSFDFGSGAVMFGQVGSGAIASGNLASGQIGKNHFASGSITSGWAIGSGSLYGRLGNQFQIASGTIGSFDLGSGIVTNTYLGESSVTSGKIGSGALPAGISFVMDGGGANVTSGFKGYVEVPFNCVIESVTLFGSTSGQMFFGIWKDTYANWPPTSGDTITTSGVPILSGNVAKMIYSGANISGWTLAMTKGDVLAFQVYSVNSGMGNASVCMSLGRT